MKSLVEVDAQSEQSVSLTIIFQKKFSNFVSETPEIPLFLPTQVPISHRRSNDFAILIATVAAFPFFRNPPYCLRGVWMLLGSGEPHIYFCRISRKLPGQLMLPVFCIFSLQCPRFSSRFVPRRPLQVLAASSRFLPTCSEGLGQFLAFCALPLQPLDI